MLFFDGFESGDASAWDNPSWVTLEVTPEDGGELHDPSTGLAISVPPQAVSSPLRIRAWRQATIEADPVSGVLDELDDDLRALHAYRFEPAGHVFALPVDFTLPVPAATLEGDWTVFLLQHGAASWAMLTVAPETARAGRVDAAGKVVGFELDRFGTFSAMAPPLPAAPPGPLRASGNVCAVVGGWSFQPIITSAYGVATSSCPTGQPCTTDAECDDGDPCTDDLCLQNLCANLEKLCFDNNICTYDFCDPLLGCNPPDPTMNGQPCLGGDPCLEWQCQGGDCQPIGSVVCDPCEECVGGECLPVVCDDGDPCTIDTCVGDECVSGPIVCDPCEECVGGNCLPVVCDDGDPCTIDTCVAGECVSGPMICDDDNPCTSDSCVNGDCVYVPIDCPPDTICVLGICIPDPTFIVPLDPAARPSGRAGLALPFAPSLVRGEIPISVELPVGSFFVVTVEDAVGERVFSCSGKVAEPFDPSFLDRLMAAARTPQGNACNWDSGLTSYSYGERYGPHSEGSTGPHTISLEALTPEGGSVQDRVQVVVANVLTYVWGGTARSPDGRITLELGEHAIEEPFQLLAVHSHLEDEDQERTVYRILSHRRSFLRPVELAVQPPAAAVHLATDPADRSTWRQLRSDSPDAFRVQLLDLPAESSFLIVGEDSSADAPHSAEQRAAPNPSVAMLAGRSASEIDGGRIDGGGIDGDIVLDDAEALAGAEPRDRRRGARLDLVDDCPAPPCLRLRNPPGGNLGTTLWRGELELRAFPRLSIDLRLDPGVSLGLLARVDGHWYELNLAGESGAYERVNITTLGDAEGVVTDGSWHRVSLDLLRHLRRAGRVTTRSAAKLEQVMVARFHAAGYLQLAPAELPTGAEVHVDRLVFHHRPRPAAPTEVAGDATPGDATQMVAPAAEWTVFTSSPSSQLVLGLDAGRLDLDYRSSRAHGFAGAYARPASADWRGFDAVRLQARQLAGQTRWSLAVKDGHEHQASVRLAPYLPDDAGAGWQTLTVPLAAFTRVDLGDVREVALALDNGLDLRRQRVAVQQLELVSLGEGGPADLVLGRFATGATAWGEPPSTFHSAGAELAAVTTTQGQVLAVGGVRSERFRESWAGWTVPLPGVDARAYGTLELRLRALSGAPSVHVKLEDGSGGEWVLPLDALDPSAEGWQELRLPLRGFKQGGAKQDGDELGGAVQGGAVQGGAVQGDAVQCSDQQGGLELSDLRAVVLTFEGSAIDGALLVDRLRFRR